MEITADVWLSFGAVMALLGASAFFSCTEITVFSVSEGREARDGSRRAAGETRRRSRHCDRTPTGCS